MSFYFLVPFLLAIMLLVLLRFTASWYLQAIIFRVGGSNFFENVLKYLKVHTNDQIS